ncbi:SH3 domain-containing protein [Turneriella parva]|uniref:SH3 type 3 domain protein n=1 Tax=Turneriella parva (strain ATCC BAA-1111 / DSM 21527 / NCTC 11395 / H) TaxID=869212 RepID=I4B6V6_TURPD|nr:SH3 domain-containing protein [Turneriella parva]AFM13013.1 SH3 type 3 domain protein [Turneriella parva DSM 21527]
MKTKTLLIATTLAALGLMATACKPKVTDTGIRYVAVKDGLNMREEPSPTGKKMLTIPYRQEVQKLEEKPESFTIDKTEGKWTKVSWQGKTGWVFGGFLSWFSPVVKADDENSSSGNSVVDHFKSLSFNNNFAMKDSNSLSIYGTDMGCARAATANEDITEDGVTFVLKYRNCPGSRGDCGTCETVRETCRITAATILATANGGSIKDSDIQCN